MNAQQMSTEELLAKATARPITISRCTCGDPVCNQWFISWTRSDGRLSAEDAELIRRAVGSFEAMRSSIVEMQAALGGISAWEHESGLSTPQVNAISRAWFAQQAALKIADAK